MAERDKQAAALEEAKNRAEFQQALARKKKLRAEMQA
jgi:hypothetical protein